MGVTLHTVLFEGPAPALAGVSYACAEDLSLRADGVGFAPRRLYIQRRSACAGERGRELFDLGCSVFDLRPYARAPTVLAGLEQRGGSQRT